MTVILAERPALPCAPEHSHDESWFSGFYEATFESAYRYACMLTRDADLASDVTADVFVRAWVHRSTLKASASPIAWVLTVTRNRVNDEFRSRKVTVNLDQIAEPEDSSPADIEPELSDAQKAFIRGSIERLTPEQQQVVFLRFYQQLPHEQVARELGRTPNAVRAIQFRALARLRKLMEAARVV